MLQGQPPKSSDGAEWARERLVQAVQAEVRKAREAPVEDDARAVEESARISQGRDIEKEAREGDHDRIESFKKHFNNVVIGGIYAAAALFLLCAFTMVYHLVVPSYWRWLSTGEVEALKTIVLSSGSGAIVAVLARRYMG